MRTRHLLLILLLVVASIVVGFAIGTGLPAHAAPAKTPVLKAWGPLRGGSSQYLYFEDASGTIRMYDVNAEALVGEFPRK